MRILFLAPQPFFQERGTPIAVRLALRVLSEREGDTIDLLTFAEGEDVQIANVKVYRIWSPWFLLGVRPGFSLKKIFCDCIFFFYAAQMLLRARINNSPYAVVHAVEESVFMALIFKLICRVPYIYDMDSSLAMQLTEKVTILRIFRPLFEWLEALAIQCSLSVIPVCDALAVIAHNKKALHIQVLPDISLHETADSDKEVVAPSLRGEAGLPTDVPVILYVGNLEHYQGVELLIESFALIAAAHRNWHLIIIGGAQKHIDQNNERIAALECRERVILLGARPVSHLSHYLRQATILGSPRILGNNTPMKIYSYMHSGVAIIATDLPTHTQVLTTEMAKLVPTDTASFAQGLAELMKSEELRKILSQRAFLEAESKYTFPIFRRTLLSIYDQVAKRLTHKT